MSDPLQNAKPATRLITLHAEHHREATDELMGLVYDQIRALARKHLQHERPDHTLTPTDLVHEAYVRLVDHTQVDWRGRSHFYAMAAKTLRRVLVDHARGRGTEKRGGEHRRITLTGSIAKTAQSPIDLVELEDLLERLAQLSQRHADVVELRFFGGLTFPETAEALGLPEDAVKWSWRMARAWLLRELNGDYGSKREGDQAT